MMDLPVGLTEFVRQSGWDDATVEPIPGDASFRRYFRLRRPSGETAMLMHAPPPEEDPQPFILVAQWLNTNGMRAPQIIAQNPREGWLLTEDFGDDRMRDWLDDYPQDERAAYKGAVDALVQLHRLPAGPFSPYDLPTYQREASLLIEWYCPAMGLDVDAVAYEAAWNEALAPLIERHDDPVTVLRDYHAENIMLLGPPGKGALQGLIDFQDALAGHRAYDLVSLLQDARRDVSEALEADMLGYYEERAGADKHFRADYALLGAQRSAKIVGIFTRLYKRDGKAKYPGLIPRVWAAMERDLQHPALEPVAKWFADNIPQTVRDQSGGAIT